MFKKMLSVFITLIIISTSFTGCLKAEKKGITSNEANFDYGNTSGNHSNGGMAAVQGEWIYFQSPYGFTNFYKMKIDGTEKIILIEDAASNNNINVVGEWIYSIGDTYHVNKMRTDGKFGTEILSNISLVNMFMVDNWIYYTDYNDNKLYRIRTDGKGKLKLSNERVSDYCVVGNTVYYCNNSLGGLFSISTDGKGKTKLSDDRISTINVADGWIYYSPLDYSVSTKAGGIWKVQTDGKKKAEVVSDFASWINVDKDWIYYVNDSDNQFLYKIRTDGTKKLQINNEYTESFNIAGEWIFFTNNTDLNQILIMRNDGTERQVV